MKKKAGKIKIGVLSLQGGVIEHINSILSLGYDALEVKNLDQLKTIDALIIPGWESTTIGKLLRVTGLFNLLKKWYKKDYLYGVPVLEWFY